MVSSKNTANPSGCNVKNTWAMSFLFCCEIGSFESHLMSDPPLRMFGNNLERKLDIKND